MNTIVIITVVGSAFNMVMGIGQKNVTASLGWFCSLLGWAVVLTG